MAHSPDILLVEDTPTMQVLYVSVLATKGYSVVCAETIEIAKRELTQQYYPLILLDLSLPDGDGMDLLVEVLHVNPQAKVIVITANASMSKAIEAMRLGACDFLVKPFSSAKLIASVEQAFTELNSASDPALTAAINDAGAKNFVGNSPGIRRLRENIEALGKTNISVFVYGEDGVDKDLCVSLLRASSPNREGPVLEVDCSDPDQDAVARKLFGGAETGFAPTENADEARNATLFDRLCGGTLILKELTGLSIDNQIELLILMQSVKTTVRKTGKHTYPNVRIICTSTKDPFKEVMEGRLRQDLFFRLYIVPVIIPPLRERREDIIPCVESFLRLAFTGKDKAAPTLSEELADLLTNYEWPGNLKEMRKLLFEMVRFYDAPVLEPFMLGEDMLKKMQKGLQGGLNSPDRAASVDIAVRKLVGLPLASLEQKFIEATIENCQGSVTKAAEILSVAPSTLYRKRETWQNSSVD